MELCYCQCCLSDLHLTISAQSSPLTRSAVRRTTLSPDEGEGVKNKQFLLSPRLVGGKGSCEKIGRASLLASYRPANPSPMRLGGSLALPIAAGFEFFHSSRGRRVRGEGGLIEKLFQRHNTRVCSFELYSFDMRNTLCLLL